MTNIAPPNKAKRFYASTCPICRDRALEAYISAQVVQIECGRCGGYGITAPARSMISKRSYALRKEWLEHARQGMSSKGEVAIVDSANQPTPDAGVTVARVNLDSSPVGNANSTFPVRQWRGN
jgi:hypothetical protein